MLIYLLKFPNGKHYVGRTKNTLEQRCTEHKARAVHGHQHPLYHAINKYGWENVTKEVLCTATTHNELVLKELEFILQYDSLSNGYNLTINTEIGGDNWEGRRDSKEYQSFVDKMKVLNSSGRMHGKSHNQSSKDQMKLKAKGRFSLEWFQERNGIEEGERLYKERNQKLKNRDYGKMKDPVTGTFKKREE